MDVSEFLELGRSGLLLDVRSPSEFHRGHIPGAQSLPLFSDDERAEVGTLYKRRGPDQAMLRGLELVGPRMAGFVRQAKALSKPGQLLGINCMRGGKRSSSMAWLLRQAGFEVSVLEGGYKAYRQSVLKDFEASQVIIILSGRTGSAKTKVLHYLKTQGEQVIDLEGLAHHKGSAFGTPPNQPHITTELFQNRLHREWMLLDRSAPLWLEDESKGLGHVQIPDALWAQMRSAQVLYLDIPVDPRVEFLVGDYEWDDPETLERCINKISKRLGDLSYRQCLEALRAGDMPGVAKICLSYYDRAYLYGLKKRCSQSIHALKRPNTDVEANAESLLKFYQSIFL